MSLWSRLFQKEKEETETKKTSYFDNDVWQRIKQTYNLNGEPYPACPIASNRDVMWTKDNALYFAPRKISDIEEIECYPLSEIKRFYVNPREHNEICIELLPSCKTSDNKRVMRFRSNSLKNFRELLPDKEYRFSKKTMQLGKETVSATDIRLGNLRDVRSGAEFEEYLTTLFRALGYHTENTKLTGDQGIDVLLSKGKERYGVQAKFYQQPVSNTAVQQVIAGREYFKLNKGLVVTNSTYTASAIKLAEKTGIRLIDGEELEKMIRMAKSGKTGGLTL